MVGGTGIEPATSSVSGKRSPAELTARDLEVETGIEPVCTALQAVASPLGHSTAGVDATAPRADDGIRTRDPHLGKVMRYQLRYIRAPLTTSSPVAKDDDSPQKCSRTNPIDGEVRTADARPVVSSGIPFARCSRASLRRRSTCTVEFPGLVAQGESVRLTRGRSLVRSQSGPQHKIPARRPIFRP